MRKWCPEPLDRNREPTPGVANDFQSFTSATSCLANPGDAPATESARFEKDHALTGGQSLWDLMSQEEKAQLLAETRATLLVEFELRERELRQQHQAEITEIQAQHTLRFENWSGEMAAQLERETQDRVTEATGLALALARKIIRDHVDADRGFLTRTVETALFKIRDPKPLTVILHPEDAQFLKDHPDLRDQLRIGNVVPDRRVEKGGCRIRSGVREWDATLTSQLDTLAAVLEESLAAAEILTPENPGGNDDPSLD
jgi:flagellar biosynthesis/type III secretory pathway protein FliH